MWLVSLSHNWFLWSDWINSCVFLRKYLYIVNSNGYCIWMLLHLFTLKDFFFFFFAIPASPSKTELPRFLKNWLPDTIWLARNNWQFNKYLCLFSQFVFNNAFCTNTAVQPLFLVYRCCYGFLHGDSHWCFPVTGNCFQCAILCIVVEVVSVYLGSTFIIVALLDQDWKIFVEFIVHNLFAIGHFFSNIDRGHRTFNFSFLRTI